MPERGLKELSGVEHVGGCNFFGFSLLGLVVEAAGKCDAEATKGGGLQKFTAIGHDKWRSRSWTSLSGSPTVARVLFSTRFMVRFKPDRQAPAVRGRLTAYLSL